MSSPPQQSSRANERATGARASGPATPKPVTGIFSNGMAYARLGDGPRSLIVIPGGPGNQAPRGLTVRMLAR